MYPPMIFHGVDKVARVSPTKEPSNRFIMETQRAIQKVRSVYPRAYAYLQIGESYNGFEGCTGIRDGTDDTIITPAHHNDSDSAWRSAAASLE